MTEKMLGLSEASKLLEASETTVKRWAREHLIKSVKNGDSLEFPESDLIKYKEMNDKFRK